MERYFRKVEGKTTPSAMKNIDFIYLINLDQRPEKLERSMRELQPYGLSPHRFPAIYGWSLPRETVEGVALKFAKGMDNGQGKPLPVIGYPGARTRLLAAEGQACFYPRMSLGAIGTALSHLSLLQDAFESSYETIWILEDDFRVAQDPHLLSGLIEELDRLEGDWDLLYTDDRNYFNAPFTPGTVWRPDAPGLDADTLILRRAVGEAFYQIGGRSQMHSVIVRRAGMKKILDFAKSRGLFLPYDIDVAFIPGFKMFNLKSEVVWGGLWSKNISDTDYRHF